MSASTGTRRRRQQVTRSDGKVITIAKAPRADVLWYPRNSWTTVLVRRTHDLELATQLAEQRWAEIAAEHPLVTHRIGWWTTTASGRCSAAGAQDQAGRVVVWCEDDTVVGVGPGIEFRPASAAS